jgi:hypothetical protein
MAKSPVRIGVGSQDGGGMRIEITDSMVQMRFQYS